MLKYDVCLCKGYDGCCGLKKIVMRGAVGACVWEVLAFRTADDVWLCLVYIL